MQVGESVEIVKRFFRAIGELKSAGIIRGKKTFTDRYGINRWNLNKLQAEPYRDMMQLSWLRNMVLDYGVNAYWLLTGLGPIFSSQMQQEILASKAAFEKRKQKQETALKKKNPVGRPRKKAE